MKKIRIFPVTALVWELIRFIWFFILMIGFYRQMWVAGTRLAPWLLAFAAGSLVIPAGYVMLLRHPKRYGPVVNLLRLGKVLQIFPVLLILGMSVIRIGDVSPQADAFLYTTAGTVVLDAIFLGLLLSFKEEQG